MLTTLRLILRPMILEDAHHLLELNSDPEVVRYTGDVACKDLRDAQKIITDLGQPQFEKFKMGRFTTLLKDGTYVGWCGLKFHPQTNEVDLGYRFQRRHWNQGYATESSQAALDYGFNELKLGLIEARVMPANIASIKVIQKLGMTFRGMINDPGQIPGFIKYDLKKEDYKK